MSRVGFVDQAIEAFHGFPDGHLGTCLGLDVVAGFEVVCHGLLGVLFAVEVLDCGRGILISSEIASCLSRCRIRTVS